MNKPNKIKALKVWHLDCKVEDMKQNNFIPAFTVFKQGVTVKPIVILREKENFFDFDFKISKYIYLGYLVTDIKR